MAWLRRNGYKAKLNPDQYGIDVLAKKGDAIYGFEVEVKHNWTGYDFPFDTVHYSARKRKFIQPNNYFTTVNKPRTAIFVVDYATLSTAPTVTKDTIYTRGEEFIEININDGVVFDMGEPT